jgi:hypothetical protein
MTTHGHHHHHGTALKTSAHATLHCLLGCVIGEVLGLAIGITFGLAVGVTITLAVILAYVSGLSLAVLPIMKHARLSFTRALRVVWIGEGISIGIMELVMNWVDYWIGGVQAMSVLEPIFWLGLLAAFLAAWPVNHWLLEKELRAPHRTTALCDQSCASEQRLSGQPWQRLRLPPSITYSLEVHVRCLRCS